MKNIIYVLFVLSGIAIVSCKTEKKHDSKHESHEMAKVEYVCPMECEVEKSYTDKDAKCPVCKMKLVVKESEEKLTHDEDGEHKEGSNHGNEKEKDSDKKN